MPPFWEIRKRLLKPTQRFACELVARRPGCVILRYVSDRPFTIAGRAVPIGSVTLARYCEGEDFVLWEMRRPDGALFGHLVHLCRNVRVGEDEVQYEDLLLDIWRPAGGKPALLDEDELTEALRTGALSTEEAERIRRRAAELCARLDELAAQLRAELSRQG